MQGQKREPEKQQIHNIPIHFTTSLFVPTPHRKLYRKQSPALSLPVAIPHTIKLGPILQINKLQLEAEQKKGFDIEERKKSSCKKRVK